MSVSAVAQINVRLDRSLKEAGDAELARLHISPSEIVRRLWERLSLGGREAEEVVDGLMAIERTPEEQAAIDAKLAAMRRIDDSWEHFAQTVGLDFSTYVPMTDEDLEEARYEYLVEKYGA